MCRALRGEHAGMRHVGLAGGEGWWVSWCGLRLVGVRGSWFGARQPRESERVLRFAAVKGV